MKINFILLITEASSNDIAADRCAEPGTAVIHHKLSYVPIYERFDELKKFQRKVRFSPAAMGKVITAAVDLSEWVGHEDEEYFAASLKFFHDKSDLIRFVFTAGEHSEKEILPMFLKLRCYMFGVIQQDKSLGSAESISEILGARGIDAVSSAVLADMIMSDSMKPIRNHPMINSICSEIIGRSGSSTTVYDTIQYLMSENSIPHIIDSAAAEKYAGIARETEAKKEIA